MWYNQKRATKFSKMTKLWISTPHFSKFRVFRKLYPLKQHVSLQFLVEIKVFNFSKRALPAGTACNNWLKKALLFTQRIICSLVRVEPHPLKGAIKFFIYIQTPGLLPLLGVCMLRILFNAGLFFFLKHLFFKVNLYIYPAIYYIPKH